MPITEAQRKAKRNYRAKVKTVCMEVYQTEQDILHRLASLDEPTATYIKRLIREDITRNGKE